MESPALLSGGIEWPADGSTPRWDLRTRHGESADLVLEPGIRCSFAVAPGRWCLGHVLVHAVGGWEHVECPRASRAERGTQCGPCLALDQARYMHDFHRSGIAPPGLREYLARPQWLYVATFAHGASKVGTAGEGNKWRRLAQQGAVAGTYVALVADGRQVRVLEDLVTGRLGLGQAVRASAKTAGLCEPGQGGPSAAGVYDAVSLARMHRSEVERVLALIAEDRQARELGIEPADEAFVPPRPAAAMLSAWDAGELYPYPGWLSASTHGFVVDSVLGQSLGVRLEGSDRLYAADAAVLKGRRVTPGEYTTAIPAAQDSLF
ncbi:MAG: DUF2797 domain-containing protein [Micrococcaceae bacterium]|nr:DUF2797 domain-containing protein [Micrococcaceae bacterium]MDN5825169.1 DUF2797 domain-containing protein [Micrococcaceae bacterium]MDN5906545.1 DUF2797 domain-containing protein [Micrococcaceae bacterium]